MGILQIVASWEIPMMTTGTRPNNERVPSTSPKTLEAEGAPSTFLCPTHQDLEPTKKRRRNTQPSKKLLCARSGVHCQGRLGLGALLKSPFNPGAVFRSVATGLPLGYKHEACVG